MNDLIFIILLFTHFIFRTVAYKILLISSSGLKGWLFVFLFVISFKHICINLYERSKQVQQFSGLPLLNTVYVTLVSKAIRLKNKINTNTHYPLPIDFKFCNAQ